MSLDLTGQPFPGDDRVLCTDCRAFATKSTELRLDDGTLYRARQGDCLQAATRRRRDVWQGYGPADVDLPRRCEHFLPMGDAADQRTGRERFPLFARLYDEAMAERQGERRATVKRGLERARAAINTS